MNSRIFLAPVVAVFFAAGHATAADLSVKVNGVNSANGTIRMALHNGAEGFPFEGQAFAEKEMPSALGAITIRFSDLAPGSYSISVFHDENGNKELDTNLLGIPKEGYGFSNNARRKLSPPKYSATQFQVGKSDMAIEINIGY